MTFTLLHFVLLALIYLSDPYSSEQGATTRIYGPTVLHLDRKAPHYSLVAHWVDHRANIESTKLGTEPAHN